VPGSPAAGGVADVVVVGAGHNALICAAYAAAAGLSVTVLEARDLIGGDTVTEELTLPGFAHDSCSSAHVLIQANPVIRADELGLRARFGLRYAYPDPAVVMPLPSGDSLTMYRDVDATAAELARWSAADAGAYRDMLAEWDADLAAAHGRWNDGLEPSAAYEALRRRSAWDVVHERFAHPVVRSLLIWLAFATIQDPARPGTGALPAAIASGRSRYGWATPIGGSGALPAALRAHIEAHGGRVVTAAPVTRILVEGDRAAGAVTADGRVFRARHAVVSAAHLTALPALLGTSPRTTVPPDAAPPATVSPCADSPGAAPPGAAPPGAAPPGAAVPLGDLGYFGTAWRPGLTLFAVHVALRADVRLRGRGGPVAAVAGALGTADGLRRQLDRFARGEPDAEDPWLLVVASTVADPARAPAGQGTLKLLTVAPYERADGRSWAATKDAYARRLLDLVAARADGLDPDSVLAVVAEAPPDLAARNPHNVGGSCHGGEFVGADGAVSRGWPSHRGPLPGLYLTGATTHPGGSVSGRPGRNTARALLADLGRTLPRQP
jgi:phytoene dehydrogenase-like protein